MARVLIIGATGGVGSRLLHQLTERGDQVLMAVNIERLSSRSATAEGPLHRPPTVFQLPGPAQDPEVLENPGT
ncbi:hypothetical protein ACFYRN_35175 [Streptomyces sp. NPDC005227]|uniref:hypothetical protein n=1 Tax=unclassified Streptomyces TaxID=2593676 RepID=UPI0036B0B890